MYYGIIYKYTSPSRGIYIGQTKNPERRKYQHKNQTVKLNTKWGIALKKYGYENMKYEVLYTIQAKSQHEYTKIANLKERHYIKKFNTYRCGYNSDIGGSNFKYSKHTIFIKIIESEDTNNETINFIKYNYSKLLFLFKRYYFKKYLSEIVELEDIEQDIILKICEIFKYHGKFYNYCLISIEHMFVNRIIKELNRKKIIIKNKFELIRRYIRSNRPNECIKFESLIRQTIMDVDLTKRESVIFMYHMVMGIKQKDISEQLNVSVETVKKDKKKIINKMSKYFKYNL